MVGELLTLNIKGFENEAALKERLISEKKSKTDNLISIIKKRDEITPEEAAMIKAHIIEKMAVQKEAITIIR